MCIEQQPFTARDWYEVARTNRIYFYEQSLEDAIAEWLPGGCMYNSKRGEFNREAYLAGWHNEQAYWNKMGPRWESLVATMP